MTLGVGPRKLGEVQEEAILLSILSYLYIPSLYVNIACLLVNDTPMKNTAIS